MANRIETVSDQRERLKPSPAYIQDNIDGPIAVAGFGIRESPEH